MQKRFDNENQLVLGNKPLTRIEKELDEIALTLGMKFANIANRYYKAKICNSKDLKILYKDLNIFKKAYEMIAKI